MPREVKALDENKICDNSSCRRIFQQKTWWQKFCSSSCGARVRFDRYLSKIEKKAVDDAMKAQSGE